jgi:hypothetical protein
MRLCDFLFKKAASPLDLPANGRPQIRESYLTCFGNQEFSWSDPKPGTNCPLMVCPMRSTRFGVFHRAFVRKLASSELPSLARPAMVDKHKAFFAKPSSQRKKHGQLNRSQNNKGETMSKKALVIGSGIALLIAANVYKNHSSQNIRVDPVRAALAWAAPNCPHGLEPGPGPMRCADPNDPSSYLYKKNKQQTEPTPPQTSNTGTYSIENVPKKVQNWCKKRTKSATELDRCWRRATDEPMPEDFRPNPNPRPGPGMICPIGTFRQGQWVKCAAQCYQNWSGIC